MKTTEIVTSYETCKIAWAKGFAREGKKLVNNFLKEMRKEADFLGKNDMEISFRDIKSVISFRGEIFGKKYHIFGRV